MSSMQCISLFILLFILELVEGSCKLLHDAPNCYLGSLTPYSLAVEANDEEWKCPGCKAVFAWVMVRHGIRYPADKRIPGLKKVLHSLQDGILQNGSLSEEERKLFKEWSMEHVKEGIGHFLHEAGATEAKWLGERYKRHLPQLFHGHFNLNHFMVRHTPTQRTRESALHFSIGLFGESAREQLIMEETEVSDEVLRPYKNCSSWLHEVKNNSQTYVEVEQYEKGPELAEVVDRLQQKTGVLNLTVWQVQKMYDACSYETGWDGERMSPWCTLFTPQDLKALEFAEDLELWYRDGHGHHLTYMASCGMTRDIHDHIRAVMSEERMLQGVFYFSHCGAISKLYTRLQLFRDPTPPTAKNFFSLRQWQSSRISSMNANVAIILYRCSGNEYRVGVYVQEKLVKLPFCPEEFCSVETFLSHIHPIRCNWATICNDADEDYYMEYLAMSLLVGYVIFCALRSGISHDGANRNARNETR